MTGKSRQRYVDGRSVAVFCMPDRNHFQRLRPVISGLAERGMAVHVFTHAAFAPDVERAGGHCVDLFAKYPLEQADDASLPMPCRYVTYAARFGEEIAADVAKSRPSLVIHSAFAVVGRVVAARLDLPRVNVCEGHNVDPARFIAELKTSPRVRIAPECLRAVGMLRDVYGMADASPFSYVSALSPLLNLYCEPPEFLTESERHVFAPLAFFGSIPEASDMGSGEPRRRSLRPAEGRTRRVYIAFGTVIWRYYTAEALRALTTLASAIARMNDVHAVISLGGAKISPEAVAGLMHRNVTVQSYVDQRLELRSALAFVTHHGLNSTHEAIAHRIPMISYPFFWDQPALAARCQAFGLAVPLVDGLLEPIGDDDIETALHELAAEEGAMQRALARARAWELAVIANRPAVLQQL